MNLLKTQTTHSKFAERFIPHRASSNLLTFEKHSEEALLSCVIAQDPLSASSLLKAQLFPRLTKQFSYSRVTTGKENSQHSDFTSDALYSPLRAHRTIPNKPFKVLDAPALQDDFYLNLVDWSPGNILSVGLASCVYLWNASNSKVEKLCDFGFTDIVTSVNWSLNDAHISIGTAQGVVLLWDVHKRRLIRSLYGHRGRVGSMAWNRHVLTTGSRDRHILHRDVRAPEDYMARLVAHKQEVCGLKWSFDGNFLCSGGNDNKLMLWNLHSSAPVDRYSEHVAAVKALAWSPHQRGLLASGGGTADRTIKYWNTLTGELVSSTETGSQVCNILFSKNSKEVVSTHGYSLNSIILWRGGEQVANLAGHNHRVLYLAMSPDGESIVTGAGDETLRFWEVFPPGKTVQLPHSAVLPNLLDVR